MADITRLEALALAGDLPGVLLDARRLAASFCMEADEGVVASFREARRSDEQSRKMHAMAADLSKQVPWCGQRLSVEQWKRFATAKLKKDKIVFDCDDKGQPSAQSGLIVIGKSTSAMGVREMGEVITWFEWFGAQHGVVWGDEAKKVAQLEEMRR